MKSFLLALIWLSTTSIYPPSVNEVYICKGKSSTKYHYTSNCRGLSNCSTDIYKVPISEAKKMKRTLCGWEK